MWKQTWSAELYVMSHIALGQTPSLKGINPTGVGLFIPIGDYKVQSRMAQLEPCLTPWANQVLGFLFVCLFVFGFAF